ncbi:MAG: ATP-binding cassette domain-containing protein, partial [Alphaproteobacteria bacterium]
MILAVQDLVLAYGDMLALDRVSLEVPERAITAIVGGNGAGKTSLIRAIAGMLTPREGAIRFKEKDIAGWPSHKVVALGIGQVAEGRQLFPSLTVGENLAMGALTPRARPSAKAALERVLALFPRLAE